MKLLASLVLAFVVAQASCGEVFRAYDCQDPKVTHHQLDLTEVEECDSAVTRYSEPVKKYAQILQVDEVEKVVGIRCHIERSYEVNKCGVDSIKYGATYYPVIDQPEAISPAECIAAFRDKKIKLDNKWHNVTVGREGTLKYLSKGTQDEYGNCLTVVEDFTRGGMSFKGYNGYTETAIVKYHFEEVHGIVEKTAEGDLAVFDMDYNEKISFNLNEKLHFSEEYGLFAIEVPRVECTDTVSQVFKGEVEYYIDNNSTGGGIGDIVMVKPENKRERGGYAGLKLTSTTMVCGGMCFATHISSLVACFLPSATATGVPVEFDSSFNQAFVASQTALSYRHFDSRLLSARRHSDLHDALCALSRKAKQDRLAALVDGNQHALTVEYGPGFRFHRAGSVAYVRKCPSTKVIMAERINKTVCTQEIPVHKRNGTKWNKEILYVDAISMVIQPVPTTMPCTDLAPVKYKVNGRWITIGSNTYIHEDPIKLKAQSNLRDSVDLDHLSAGISANGIFTDEQLKAHHRYFVATMVKNQVAAHLVDKILNHLEENSGFELGSVVSESDLPFILGDIYYYFQLLMDVGTWFFAKSAAIYIVVCMMQTVGNFYFRIRLGLQVHGRPGLWMFSCLLDTAFHAAITNAAGVQDLRAQLKAEIIREQLGEKDDHLDSGHLPQDCREEEEA